MCNNFLPSRSTKIHLVLVFFSVLLTGCSSLTSQTIRSVKDNVFYSTAQPKLKISVGSDFKYIGVEKNDKTIDAQDKKIKVKHERYHFVLHDKNSKIEKGITINISEIFNSRWSSDHTKNFPEKTTSGTTRLGNNYYQYVVSGAILDGNYYANNGYIPSEEVFMVAFMRNVGVNNEISFGIIYYESADSLEKRFNGVSSFETLMGFEPGWNTPQDEADTFNANKEEIITNDLFECAKAAIQILDIEGGEVKTLIAADNKIKSNTEKLIALKKLKDAGAISGQDYENKKKQLLESF